MATEETFYFSVDEAITLHILLMREWRETRFGVDRKDLLESALNRPKQAANFEDADLIRQAATLCFGLVKNHPWLGGNKRTATYLMEIFLEMNGFELAATDEEIFEKVLMVESDAWKVDEIENWLRERIEKI
ncbi:MAG TPA: type II toxin-antitoxin system death-on-curing family toxin [Pyrinomonadaceae bacterium]